MPEKRDVRPPVVYAGVSWDADGRDFAWTRAPGPHTGVFWGCVVPAMSLGVLPLCDHDGRRHLVPVWDGLIPVPHDYAEVHCESTDPDASAIEERRREIEEAETEELLRIAKDEGLYDPDDPPSDLEGLLEELRDRYPDACEWPCENLLDEAARFGMAAREGFEWGPPLRGGNLLAYLNKMRHEWGADGFLALSTRGALESFQIVHLTALDQIIPDHWPEDWA